MTWERKSGTQQRWEARARGQMLHVSKALVMGKSKGDTKARLIVQPGSGVSYRRPPPPATQWAEGKFSTEPTDKEENANG